MSPLIVLLVSLAGAVLGGLVGVLLAIPLASAAQIAVGELLRVKGIGHLSDLDLAELRGGKADGEGGPLPLSRDDEEAGEEVTPVAQPESGESTRQRPAA